MSKYIDAEKLKAEIRRRMESHRKASADGYIIDPNRLDEDEDILSFITSLQQEQPEVDLKMVVRIDNIVMNLLSEGYNNGYKTRPFYEEVVRKFNAKREDK